MKKYLILILAITLSLSTFAQNEKGGKKDKEEWRKELQDFKLKYFAQEMELDESQQSKFFDLYIKMENEKRTTFSNGKSKSRKIRKSNTKVSDAEYESAVDAMLNAKILEAQIEKRYYEQFKGVLTPKQLFILQQSEHKFNKKLMEMRKDKAKTNK